MRYSPWGILVPLMAVIGCGGPVAREPLPAPRLQATTTSAASAEASWRRLSEAIPAGMERLQVEQRIAAARPTGQLGEISTVCANDDCTCAYALDDRWRIRVRYAYVTGADGERVARHPHAPVVLAQLERRPPEQATAGQPAAPRFTLGKQAYQGRYFPAKIARTDAPGMICLWQAGTGWVIDPLRPSLDRAFSCRWELVAVSADRSQAIALGEDRKPGVVDLKRGTFRPILDASNGGLAEWVFSPSGRYAYALNGYGKAGWSYLDLEQAREVTVKIPGLAEEDYAYWHGALLDDGKRVCLFMRGDQLRQRIEFPIDQPERRASHANEANIVEVYRVRGDQLACRIDVDKFCLASTRTWQVVQELTGDDQRARLLARPGPEGRHGYFTDSRRGVLIFDAKTDSLVRAFDERDGRFWNASSLGVTFSANGRFGAVTTPYEGRLSLIDLDKREVVERLPVVPSCVALLLEPAQPGELAECLVVPTSLPFE